MFDIHFYMRAHDLKKRIMAGEKPPKAETFRLLESFRSRKPVVYNIETTNACNMRCEMCPRTTMMTRKVATLSLASFERIVDQLAPFSAQEWSAWERFVEREYGIPRDGMSENHFFLHIIPRVLVLHGYGDPLLDAKMPERVKMLTARGISSYFSCNPANIDVEKSARMFENGLGYVKYSVESVDDLKHKRIRGQASDFSESYRRILQLLDLKKKAGYKTRIVITMLNLNRPDQAEEFRRLREAFKGLDVYIYLKSQDQQWYKDGRYKTQSIHWLEFCQFPWSSMTVKSNGESVMCVEDFNNAIILGDAKKQSLESIWNGRRYAKLRRDHFDLTRGIKCSEQCDMSLIGRLVG